LKLLQDIERKKNPISRPSRLF